MIDSAKFSLSGLSVISGLTLQSQLKANDVILKDEYWQPSSQTEKF